MQIKSIKLKNFQLFESAEITFDKTNLIVGSNFDSEEQNNMFSGNGAGKSTILNAIIFALYGNVTNLNLNDLLRIGAKECSVELECSLNTEQLRIVRKIPSELHIFINGQEQKYNTATIIQTKLNELLQDDVNRFRTYRMIDQSKGINLLDLGIVSLRKTLMDLINAQFVQYRSTLLEKKLERERFSIEKKLYHFYVSEKRFDILRAGLERLKLEQTTVSKDKKEQEVVCNKLNGEIEAKKNLIYYKEQDKKKMNNGYCPILSSKCSMLEDKLSEVMKEKTREIANLNADIASIEANLRAEENCLEYYNSLYLEIQKHVNLVNNYSMKLNEAAKFSDYKYTKEDIQLYADSIKTLDSFSGFYVMQWLTNLGLIINDLLSPVNISVEFSAEKDFIKVNNAGQELNYSQLSSGQKTFLNTIFKVGILLNEGISDGLLLIDEGINTIDNTNFLKLLEILKTLNFQSIIIYQNCPKELDYITYINVERKNGLSNIH